MPTLKKVKLLADDLTKLNAAANHGYLPRNGIASIEQTVSGLGALYNLGPRISAVLAAYAVVTEGNVAEGGKTRGHKACGVSCLGPCLQVFDPATILYYLSSS
jgi:hypothetical protein